MVCFIPNLIYIITFVCGFEIDLKFIEGFRRFSSFILLNLEFDIIMTVVG